MVGIRNPAAHLQALAPDQESVAPRDEDWHGDSRADQPRPEARHAEEGAGLRRQHEDGVDPRFRAIGVVSTIAQGKEL